MNETEFLGLRWFLNQGTNIKDIRRRKPGEPDFWVGEQGYEIKRLTGKNALIFTMVQHETFSVIDPTIVVFGDSDAPLVVSRYSSVRDKLAVLTLPKRAQVKNGKGRTRAPREKEMSSLDTIRKVFRLTTGTLALFSSACDSVGNRSYVVVYGIGDVLSENERAEVATDVRSMGRVPIFADDVRGSAPIACTKCGHVTDTTSFEERYVRCGGCKTSFPNPYFRGKK